MSLMEALIAFLAPLALEKAKYKRKIPTGKFRQRKDGGAGKEIFRYIYTNEGAASGVEEGHHLNLNKRGVHEVVKSDHEGVTLRHAKTGVERRLTHDELHDELATAYRKDFDKGAELLLKRYASAAASIKADPDDPQATAKVLASRFKAAGVDPTHAARLVDYLASRKGWESDAKKALLTLASDPKIGKSVSSRGVSIAQGAEGLSRRDGSKTVEPKHVGQAVAVRLPPGGFDEKLADTRQRIGMELAKTEALLGAIEASSGNASVKQAMVDHASSQLEDSVTHEIDNLVAAYPTLRDMPEVKRLNEARSRWLAIRNEQDPERRKVSGGFDGAPTKVYVSDADGNPVAQNARYRLIDAGDAIASHNVVSGFSVNKGYPEGVQERQYHRDRAEQEKVRKNAQGLKPAYVVNTNPDAVNGPPVMTKDGVVLGGNSRTMSIQLAYEDHPEAANAYKSFLKDNAHSFGLTSKDVDSMKQPMLVRQVDVDDKSKGNLGVLVRRYNESFTQGMDPRVDQVARGRMVTKGMLDSVASGMSRTNDSGEPMFSTLKEFLGSSDGMRFVSDLSSSSEGKSIIDRRNRTQYVGKDGKLNEDGKTFVERVLVGHVLPDPDLLSDMLPSHVSAVAAAVPHIVSAGSKGHDVRDSFKAALDAHAYMRRKGLKSVQEYDNDSGGFASLGIEGFDSKPKLDDNAKALLDVVSDSIGKPAQFASFFREFAKHARANPAGQTNLLGDSADSDTASLLRRAGDRTKPGQRSMFMGSRNGAASVKLEKADMITWIPLATDFGDFLWSRSLAKAARPAKGVDGSETIALPPMIAKAMLGDVLWKAGAKGGTYTKRVPTGKFRTKKDGSKGSEIYRYFYGVPHHMAAHEDMKAGASYKHADGELKIHGVKDGKLQVSHSSKPKQIEHITHEELSSRIKAQHGGAMAAEKAKLTARLHQDLADAKEYGSAKHVARILDEMKARGVEPPKDPEAAKVEPAEPLPKAWEEWGDRPKGKAVDFTGHPWAGELGKIGKDRFGVIVTRKKGAEYGRGKDRKLYGDAKVQVSGVFGFDYGQMLQDTKTGLDAIDPIKVAEKSKAKGWVRDPDTKQNVQVDVTEDDFKQAYAELAESIQKSINGEHNKETGLRPLEVDGKRLPGIKVYRGDGDEYTGAPQNKPKPDTIYISTMQINSVELEPPANGHREAESSPKVVAKEILRKMLPLGHYRNYELKRGGDWTIRVDGLELKAEDIEKAMGLMKGGKTMRKGDNWDDTADGFDPLDPFSTDGVIEGGVIELPSSDVSMFKGTRWIPMSEAFGEFLWSATLAKGDKTIDTDGGQVIQLSGGLAKAFLGDVLMKAGARGPHIKKVPTGKFRVKKDGSAGAQIFRYYYAAHHGGGVKNREHFKAGAAFKHGDGHLVIHGAKDGKLEVKHSKTGETRHLTHDELDAELDKEHGAALGAHKEKLTKEHAEAVAAGNEKGAKRIRDEAAKIGHKVEAPKNAKVPKPKAAKESKADMSDDAKHAHKQLSEGDSGAWLLHDEGDHDNLIKYHSDRMARYEKLAKKGHASAAEAHADAADELKLQRGLKELKDSGKVPTKPSPKSKPEGPKAPTQEEWAKNTQKQWEEIQARRAKAEAPKAKDPAPKSEPEKSKAEPAKETPKAEEPKPAKPEPAKTDDKPTKTHEDHVADAKDTYGLKGKERDRLDAHDYVKKAKEHHEKGEHDKADRYVRDAVKEVLYRTSERNMSASSADKHMKNIEKKLKKGGDILDALDALAPLFKADEVEIVYNKPRKLRDGEPGFGVETHLVHAKANDGRTRVIRFTPNPKTDKAKANDLMTVDFWEAGNTV